LVHGTDFQSEDRESPYHVAIDETVIHLNDKQYWLYTTAATNQRTTACKVGTGHSEGSLSFILTELSEKHDVSDAVFLVDGSHSL